MPTINFGTNANQAVVSNHSKKILEDILTDAGLGSCRITSTSRTPADQARVMFNNLMEFGVKAQKKLYGSFGDAVIDVFVQERLKGNSPDEIKKAMEKKIIALGPSRVSRHCSDPKILNVIDVAPGSIANKKAFETAVRQAVKDKKVKKFLMPPDDPAYHLEIPQT
jgi:hypothetical protein